MFGDIFCCHTGMEDATAMQWVEARDAVKNPTTLRAAPPPTLPYNELCIPYVNSTD
jgi:hypothetical protein